MSALYVVALLCWASLSHSAPLACEHSVRPVDQLQFSDLKGNWGLISAAINNETMLETLKGRDSVSIGFSSNADPSDISFTRISSTEGSCQYMKSNLVLNGSRLQNPESGASLTFLNTSCSDCLVMKYDNIHNTLKRFYLFSKRREVEPKELEEFKAQTECLALPAPAMMDPTKELCPEESGEEEATGAPSA